MFGVVSSYLILVVIRPQLTKVEEILEVETEKRSLLSRGESFALNGPVVMEDVWFRYTPDGPWVLKGYNLRVEPGEKFTIVGPSGSGKSTVLRLLAGLYVPEKGTITIGGHSPIAVRHKMLYLPQFVQLYGGSIIENLRLLSGGEHLDRLMEASQKTGLHAVVDTLPMNYHTVVPHGGRNLSGGQRQLIALTGALASRRELMFLDEATASMGSTWMAQIKILIDAAPRTLVMANHEPIC